MEYKDFGLPHILNAKEMSVIVVENTIGEGTKESIVRNMLSLFTKSGKLICTIDPAEIDNLGGRCTKWEDFYH